MANNAVSLNNRHDYLSDGATHDTGACQGRVYRTWFFWSFVLIPIVVVLGWTRYISFSSMPWLGIRDAQHAVHWNEWMRYYIWLQLVWLPANMMIFLIWCALGVRIWNHKRKPCFC
ncbi:hypothetical protein [Herbaspirillum sp. RV1423]|uniref:hypothetical protein n=1 Tax=Herbaspirillum sp. RV1423 TaxID=1443993 RepID=UPI0018CC2222|nr:hypothetical protein [Herbaspirillum sp. RV1423]